MIPAPVHPRLADAMAQTGYAWSIWERGPFGWRTRGEHSRHRAEVWARMRAPVGGVGLSYPDIARACGSPCHSTIIAALRMVLAQGAKNATGAKPDGLAAMVAVQGGRA